MWGVCCPRAAIAHTAAAPPSSVMNWPRFMSLAYLEAKPFGGRWVEDEIN
jgi:hypothetical protein